MGKGGKGSGDRCCDAVAQSRGRRLELVAAEVMGSFGVWTDLNGRVNSSF